MATQLQPTDGPHGFNIVLDPSCRKEVYYPGDVLKGRVVLQVDGEQAIGTVRVQLWGRCKTKLYHTDERGRTTHRGRFNLISQSQVLYRGSYTHKSPAFEWPFEFTIPLKSEKPHIIDPNWSKLHMQFVSMNDDTTLPLPATYSHSESRPIIGKKYECFVEYKLQASVSKPGSLDTSLETETTLNLARPPVDARLEINTSRVYDRLYNVSSYELDPTHQAHKRTLKEDMRSMFSSSKVPFAKFRVICLGPKQIVLNEPITLFLELKHLERSPELPEPPEVKLSKLSIALYAQVWVRAESGRLSTPENDSEEVVNMSRSERSFGLFKAEDMYLIDASLPGIPQKSLTPSFKMPNVTLNYVLDLKAVLECGDESLDYETRLPVQLLPARSLDLPPEDEYGLSSGGLVQGGLANDDGRELPSYKEALH